MIPREQNMSRPSKRLLFGALLAAGIAFVGLGLIISGNGRQSGHGGMLSKIKPSIPVRVACTTCFATAPWRELRDVLPVKLQHRLHHISYYYLNNGHSLPEWRLTDTYAWEGPVMPCGMILHDEQKQGFLFIAANILPAKELLHG